MHMFVNNNIIIETVFESFQISIVTSLRAVESLITLSKRIQIQPIQLTIPG